MNKGFKSLKIVDFRHGAVCRAFSYALLCTFVKGICIIEHHMHATYTFDSN